MRLPLFLALFAVEANAASVSFTNDIAPILAQKCIACHNDQKAKGSFQLHTFDALKKGIKGDPVLTAGNPDKSTLYQTLIIPDEDSRMPQEDEPLPAAQIALIKKWIEEGATFDGSDPNASIKSFVVALNFPEPPATYPHPIPVLALAFSPDGAELVSSGYHEALVWKDGQLLRRIKPLPQRIQSLAYSPDGKLLAIASGTPGRVGQLHLSEGENLRPLVTTPDVVLTAAFNPDASLLACGGADNTIRVFEMPSGKLKFKTEQHADWVLSLAFHPTTNLLVSASRDKTARIINTLNGDLEATYQGHGDAVFAAAFSHDGKRAFSAGRDKEIHAWEIREAKKLGETSADAELYRLLVHSNDLFICGADKLVRLYRAADKPELIRSFTGHEDVVYALAFHPPTRRLATAGYDGQIRLYNPDTAGPIKSFKATPSRTLSAR